MLIIKAFTLLQKAPAQSELPVSPEIPPCPCVSKQGSQRHSTLFALSWLFMAELAMNGLNSQTEGYFYPAGGSCPPG